MLAYSSSHFHPRSGRPFLVARLSPPVRAHQREAQKVPLDWSLFTSMHEERRRRHTPSSVHFSRQVIYLHIILHIPHNTPSATASGIQSDPNLFGRAKCSTHDIYQALASTCHFACLLSLQQHAHCKDLGHLLHPHCRIYVLLGRASLTHWFPRWVPSTLNGTVIPIFCIDG